MRNEATYYDPNAIDDAMRRAKAERSKAMAEMLKALFRPLLGQTDDKDHRGLGAGHTSLAG